MTDKKESNILEIIAHHKKPAFCPFSRKQCTADENVSACKYFNGLTLEFGNLDADLSNQIIVYHPICTYPKSLRFINKLNS